MLSIGLFQLTLNLIAHRCSKLLFPISVTHTHARARTHTHTNRSTKTRTEISVVTLASWNSYSKSMRRLPTLHVKGEAAVLPDRAINWQSQYFIYRPRKSIKLFCMLFHVTSRFLRTKQTTNGVQWTEGHAVIENQGLHDVFLPSSGVLTF
jgi:hypothetical protein